MPARHTPHRNLPDRTSPDREPGDRSRDDDRPLSAYAVSKPAVPKRDVSKRDVSAAGASRNHRGPFGLPAVWTDAKVERLRALWADPSYSAAAIARLLGGMSRSAVLGKVRRLGLESRAGVPALRHARTPGQVVPFHLRTAAAARRDGRTRGRDAGARGANGDGANGNDATVLPFRRLTIEDWLAPRTQDFVDLPPDTSAFAVTLAELTPRHCRWPLGDPASDGFRFCGDSIASRPYCARHHAMAYRPASR